MTSPPSWTAERTVDAGRAAELIAVAVPELAGTPVEPLATGWDNTVHRVDGWVARFPRRAVALPGFRRELAVLPRIAGRLPLPVPEPRWIADDGDPAEPWPFAVAPMLPGRELAETALADDAREPVAAAVGTFLAALHAPATRALVDGLDLPVDPLRRAEPGARREQVLAQLADLADRGLLRPDPAVEELLREGAALPPPSTVPVLVHGDLHVRHVLVDADGAAVGVIDWGDVCLADPAVDLSLAYAAFRDEARRALLASYGPVDPVTELRARCLAVRLSVLLAGYAAAEDRPALRNEALAGLVRAVA